MRLSILMYVVLCATANARAQEVPQRVLDSIIRHHIERGMRLERIIRPDFSQPAAPNHTYLGPCYPGKLLMVIILMAKKPADLAFKVTSAGMIKEFPPLQEFELFGKKYWLGFRVVVFKKDLMDKSNSCLFVRSDDRGEARLPIYQIFLTNTY